MKNTITLRSMNPDDWPEVAEIYRQGIDTGHATFQLEVPTWGEWDAAHLPVCRIVADLGAHVVGWAALTPVSGRCVYAGVAEVSVYVSSHHWGNRIGYQLLERLIKTSEQNNYWTLQAGIFPENLASVKLHEALGFRHVGLRERIGKMHGVWRDTLLLERRSKIIGIK